MDCKEFEKLIPAFIEQKLDFLTMKKFCEHLEHCAECKEELVIQFLVTEGMQRLEEGDAFDLQNELKHRVNEAKRKIKLHLGFLQVGEVFEIIAVILIAGIIVWMIY